MPSSKYSVSLSVTDNSADNLLLNGNYIDPALTTPCAYNRSFYLENTTNIYLNNVVYTDEDFWYFYQIKTVTKSIGKIQINNKNTANQLALKQFVLRNEMIRDLIKDPYIYKNIALRPMKLEIESVRFYHPMSNEHIIIPLHASTVNDWSFTPSISQNYNIQHWTLLSRNYPNRANELFEFIEPLLCCRNEPKQKYGANNTISQIDINSIQVNIEDAPLFNGVYKAMDLNNYWKRFSVFNSPAHIITHTNFYKEVIHDNSNRTLYCLSHHKDNNVHTWTLKSHSIIMVSRSKNPFNVTATPDTIQWQKYKQQNRKSKTSINYDLKVEITNDKLFEAPFIQKIILHYSPTKDYETMSPSYITSVLMAPYLAFKIGVLYLERATSTNTNGQILSSIKFIFVRIEDCIQTSLQFVWLKLKTLDIKSEILGGQVYGHLDVLFFDMSTCIKWVNLFNANQAQFEDDEKLTISRVKWMLVNHPQHNQYRIIRYIANWIL